MKIDVRLHAVLKDLLPDGKGEIELSDGSTVTDLLDHLKIDPEFRELITVNGEQVEDQSTLLREGDKVQVFPAVAGGKRSPYVDEGVRLFNDGDYFLSHETFEERWIEAPDDERDFLQGLIHLAVGFHHYRKGNRNGARSQFFKARRRLAPYPDEHDGINLGSVREFLARAIESLESGDALPSFRL